MHHPRHRDPGAAKRRDIARSTLPTTSRQGARRALSIVRRSDRRAVHQTLARVRGARLSHAPDAGPGDSLCESCDTDTISTEPIPSCSESCALSWLTLPDYPLHAHLHAIHRRRSHDKLGPLLRWAAAATEAMEPDAARRHLEGVLPPGVLGAHAISHLEGTVLPRQKLDWFLDCLPVADDP